MKRLVILTLAGLLAACSSNAQKSAQDLASAAPQQAQDALIAGSVHAKMVAIDVDATAVHVEVDRGHVTLTGEARNDAQRSAFENAARSVGGVTGVTDRVRVNPKLRGARESVGDAALVTRVMGALAAQTGINAFSIKASAHDGALTLTGTVKSQATKAAMLDAARHVNGVRVVTDRIEVR